MTLVIQVAAFVVFVILFTTMVVLAGLTVIKLLKNDNYTHNNSEMSDYVALAIVAFMAFFIAVVFGWLL